MSYRRKHTVFSGKNTGASGEYALVRAKTVMGAYMPIQVSSTKINGCCVSNSSLQFQRKRHQQMCCQDTVDFVEGAK